MATQTLQAGFSLQDPVMFGETYYQGNFYVATLDPSDITPSGPGITLDVTNTIVNIAAGYWQIDTCQVTLTSAWIIDDPVNGAVYSWGAQAGLFNNVTLTYYPLLSASGNFTAPAVPANQVESFVDIDLASTTISGTDPFSFQLSRTIRADGISLSAQEPITGLNDARGTTSVFVFMQWSDQPFPPPPPATIVSVSHMAVLPLGRKVRLDCERKINLGL